MYKHVQPFVIWSRKAVFSLLGQSQTTNCAVIYSNTAHVHLHTNNLLQKKKKKINWICIGLAVTIFKMVSINMASNVTFWFLIHHYFPLC